MRHINTKIATLLHEGFSISTLESLNETQINLLYEKAKKVKKEPKEEVTKTIKQYNLGNKEDKDKFLDASKAVTDKNKVNFDPKNDTASIGETELQEKSKSKQQQKIMGLALSVKRGDTPKSKVSKSVKDMSNKMSEKDLEDFASTKHKGLPKKVESKDSVKKLEEGIMKLIEDHLPPHTTKGELIYAIRRHKR
jgi:hypothetical protein